MLHRRAIFSDTTASRLKTKRPGFTFLNAKPGLIRTRRRHSAPVAESEGFEPPEPCSSTVFKTAAIDHSANFPRAKITRIFRSAKSCPLFIAAATAPAVGKAWGKGERKPGERGGEGAGREGGGGQGGPRHPDRTESEEKCADFLSLPKRWLSLSTVRSMSNFFTGNHHEQGPVCRSRRARSEHLEG